MKKAVFILLVYLFFVGVFDVKAQQPDNCDPKIRHCGPYGNECCRYGAICPSENCSGSSANVCCTSSSGCDLNGEPSHISQWTYAYNATCKVSWATDDDYECKYYWSYDTCGAGDTCAGGVTLKSGLCTASGCAVGGDYKTCCSPSGGTENCIGGVHSGYCPHITKFCGFRDPNTGEVYPSCGAPACCSPPNCVENGTCYAPSCTLGACPSGCGWQGKPIITDFEWASWSSLLPPNTRLKPTAPPLASLAPALRLSRQSLCGPPKMRV